MFAKICLAAGATALTLTGCSFFADEDSQPAPEPTPEQRLERTLPADTQLIQQKLTYLFTPSDSIYVINGGDYSASGSFYENSGVNLQYQLATVLEQHGSSAVRQQGYYDPNLMQQEAQTYNCNLIMVARIEHLSDIAHRSKELSVLLNTYSAASGDLLNSVVLNARGDSLQQLFDVNSGLIGGLINSYVDSLYRKVGAL